MCRHCKFLDGTGRTDGFVISLLRDVRLMSLAELTESLGMDVRSVQRALNRMMVRGRLERVRVDVVLHNTRGSETRWMYRLRG